MSEHDRELRYTWSHNLTGDPIGKTPSEAFGEAIGKPLEAILGRGLVEPQFKELELVVDVNAMWLAVQTAPAARADGVASVGASALDITHRKQNERKLEVLARELSHRVKNLFALVRAMVHQNARDSGVSAYCLATLDDRLEALAGAQDVRLVTDAESAVLHELLETQVGHLSGVSLNGSTALVIPARAVPYVALAIRELGTDATKYGSLSVPEGRVDLSWSVGDDGFVNLIWSEFSGLLRLGGPGKGFGTHLLTRVFSGATWEMQHLLTRTPD